MGFDQYHEPPNELPGQTRTFARLCASLTEEAEAIGWYEQRLAVEQDPEAKAVMSDAVGEEYKHFSMDLEFLLRRTPKWRQIAKGVLFQEARERLLPGLATRRLVDFSGPHGWELSATNLGRVEQANVSEQKGVEASRRVVLPLIELRSRFTVSREELRAGDRGADDVDFASLDAAAQRIVDAENTAVFHAWPKAGIDGITASSPHKPIVRGKSFDDYPGCVARAVELLLRNGIEGPYGIALGREDYTSVVETGEHGGYPLLDHLRKILKGPIVWAPGVVGAVVLSMRGGDFELNSGQDLSVGYETHDTDAVSLYIEESYSFRVLTPEAAVAITPPKAR